MSPKRSFTGQEAKDWRLSRRQPESPKFDAECIHCKQPFLRSTSRGGEHDFCSYCIDRD